MKTAKFITKAITIHGNLYDYSQVEYTNNRIKVKIICKEHGKFLQSPDGHLNQKQGCPKCGRIKTHQSHLYSKEQFIVKAQAIHGNKYDYTDSEYVHSKLKIAIKCPLHGQFTQTPDNHINQKQGCPKCRTSLGENAIREWLVKYHIKFEEQKRFKDCRDKLPLPFDFYLPEHNCCIEFDGIQHHTPQSFSSDKSVQTCMNNYNNQIKKDQIKTNYTTTKGIKLIRINYKQFRYIGMQLEILL